MAFRRPSLSIAKAKSFLEGSGRRGRAGIPMPSAQCSRRYPDTCTSYKPLYSQASDTIIFRIISNRGATAMGHKQTTTHRFGKASYHQIGLVRGQFGNVPMDKWVKFLHETGFDGWEEASWELDLDRCNTDSGAEAY